MERVGIMNKAGWMTGTLTGLVLLMASGTAMAQLDQRYDRQDEPGATYQHDEQSPAPDDQDGVDARQTAGRSADRAEDDFSDIAAAAEPQDEAQANDPETDTVIDSCAIAARDEAERDGGYAEVRQVETPRETRQGYTVDGDVEVRASWRAQDGQARHFTCAVENGRVADIYFHRGRAAAR